MPNEEQKAPSRALIEEVLKLEEQRKEANRLADACERAAKPLKLAITKYIEAAGGKEKRVKRCGFILALLEKNGQISWKDEFARVAGEVEAARVAATPPKVERLSIEKAA
jgi:hypothetical protein